MNSIQKMKLHLIEKGILTTGMNDAAVTTLHAEHFGSAETPAPDKPKPAPKPKTPKPAPKAPKAAPAPRAPVGSLESAIESIIDARLQGFDPAAPAAIDTDQIEKLIKEHAQQTITVEVKTPKKTEKIEGAHKSLEELVKWLGVGEHVYMHGPAGSGKTTLASQAAKALGKKLYKTGAVLSKYELVGFVDAGGTYHPTAFRTAWEQGDLFLFDEMDSSAAEAIVAINDALSNGTYTFPDQSEPVPMGEGFGAIGAGNTTGTGATRQYVGRNPLDAASRDRFKVMEVEYDKRLEKRIALAAFKQYGGKDENVGECGLFINKLRQVRTFSDKRGFNVVLSPRGSVRVAKAVALGLPESAIDQEIYNGFSADQIKQIKQEA